MEVTYRLKVYLLFLVILDGFKHYFFLSICITYLFVICLIQCEISHYRHACTRTHTTEMVRWQKTTLHKRSVSKKLNLCLMETKVFPSVCLGTGIQENIVPNALEIIAPIKSHQIACLI